MEFKVINRIIEWNDSCHNEVQKELNKKGIFMINVMGSKGSGKSSFIVNLIKELENHRLKVAVIEGDIDGARGRKKIVETGADVVKLNSKGACHIEAREIKKMLPKFDLEDIDVLIVENVGDLVCPADFNIGENLKIMLLSIPEGDEMVMDYPDMFEKSDALILTKYDMLEEFSFNEEKVINHCKNINEKIKVFKANNKEEGTLKNFGNWLVKRLNEVV